MAEPPIIQASRCRSIRSVSAESACASRWPVVACGRDAIVPAWLRVAHRDLGGLTMLLATPLGFVLSLLGVSSTRTAGRHRGPGSHGALIRFFPGVHPLRVDRSGSRAALGVGKQQPVPLTLALPTNLSSEMVRTLHRVPIIPGEVRGRVERVLTKFGSAKRVSSRRVLSPKRSSQQRAQ